jgi:hypothetical protein
MELLGVVSHVESRFFPFGGSVKAQVEVIQDRCTIFVKRTIGAKIILDAPDGMLR